jgi:hypothetical protein
MDILSLILAMSFMLGCFVVGLILVKIVGASPKQESAVNNNDDSRSFSNNNLGYNDPNNTANPAHPFYIFDETNSH